MEDPERFGYTKKEVVKIDIRHHLAAKLASYRAHRCQTEMDEWVWEADNKALAHFGKHEYFIVGNQNDLPSVADELFQPNAG